ncbi:MAG TPA: GPW/gp25 family protein [Myxococcota bacterium]|nr:GPW/gp25 family protein [Myxococcota bacterium]
MKKEFLGRGWAWPLRFDPATGAVATSAAEDNIRESMTLVLGTRPGERQMMPDFGCRIHELVYTPNTQANASLVAYHVRAALQRWEPRIDVLDVKAEPTPGGKVQVQVRYRVKSTLAEQTLSLDVAAGG